METTQELFEKIDDYLNNRMNVKELDDFKKELELDEELREEVVKHQQVKTVLSDEESINFRKKLLKIDEELADEKDTVIPISSNKGIHKYWRIAAVFVALIGLSSVFWMSNPSQEDALFSQYYIPYPMGDLTRGQENSIDKELNELTSNYRKKEYQKVISFLESEKAIVSDNDQLQLYLGNSYLNIDKEQKAITTFQSIEKDSKFYTDAQWFLALTYIKSNKKDKATTILKDLGSYSNLYTSKALQLIDSLK